MRRAATLQLLPACALTLVFAAATAAPLLDPLSELSNDALAVSDTAPEPELQSIVATVEPPHPQLVRIEQQPARPEHATDSFARP